MNGPKPLNWIELSRSALFHNVAVLQKISGIDTVIPVLKSNAYGHGILEMSQLVSEAGCELIAVNSYHEARQVRKLTNAKVLVMGPVGINNYDNIETSRTEFVIYDQLSLEAAASMKQPFVIHLEFNTGMNRQGFDASEIDNVLQTLERNPQLTVNGIMSHFADADNPKSDTFTEEQIGKFDRIVESLLNSGLKPKYIHLAQSPGITRPKSKYANAVRPGIALYGINPLEKSDAQFNVLEQTTPVMRVMSSISEIREIKPGETVSYGRTFTAKNPMKVAVVPFGYYEGLPRNASNTNTLKINGKQSQITGRVCMNHTMIDVTDLNLNIGDEVEIISSRRNDPNSLQSICDTLDLFNYEFAVHFAPTLPRKIVD